MHDSVDVYDRTSPPSHAMLEPGQVWAWMNGEDPPRFEVCGTGVSLGPAEDARFRADRAKDFENEYKTIMPDWGHSVIRVDGRGFSQLTRHIAKPFDSFFMDAMKWVCDSLMKEITHSAIGFVQSDEVSIICRDLSGTNTQPWMGGVHSKYVSLSAATATMAFNDSDDGYLRPGMFDSRAWQLSSSHALDYLRVRQADAKRNALAMVCDKRLGKKATVGKSTRERLDLLGVDSVIELDDFRDDAFFGTVFYWTQVPFKAGVYRADNGTEYTVEAGTRRVLKREFAPDFSAFNTFEQLLESY